MLIPGLVFAGMNSEENGKSFIITSLHASPYPNIAASNPVAVSDSCTSSDKNRIFGVATTTNYGSNKMEWDECNTYQTSSCNGFEVQVATKYFHVYAIIIIFNPETLATYPPDFCA